MATASTAGSASTKKKKHKAPVTPPRADEALAAEGRAIQAAFKKFFTEMRKRKPKLCAASLLTEFTAQLRKTTTAITAHAHATDAERAAKKAKDAMLEVLLVEIKSILADIVLAADTAEFMHLDHTGMARIAVGGFERNYLAAVRFSFPDQLFNTVEQPA